MLSVNTVQTDMNDCAVSTSQHDALPAEDPGRACIYLGRITLSKQFGWQLSACCSSLSVCSHTEIIR